MSKRVDLAQHKERENRYLSLTKKYEPDEVLRFPQILAELTMAIKIGPDDVLCQVFSELELGNSARGQFFTSLSGAHSAVQYRERRFYDDPGHFLKRRRQGGRCGN